MAGRPNIIGFVCIITVFDFTGSLQPGWYNSVETDYDLQLMLQELLYVKDLEMYE
jgi:hypothetical protein